MAPLRSLERAEYRDDVILCDARGLRIRRYYFPLGGTKQIAWEEIRRFEERALGPLTGRSKVWGVGFIPAWFNRDLRRSEKTRVFFLDIGGYIRVAVTPDRPDEFRSALLRHTREICIS